MKKFLKAFTMIEICLVLVIVGAFFITLRNSFNRGAIDQKKMVILSRTFYGEVQKALMKIAFDEARQDGLKKFTSEELAVRLEQYLSGEYKNESAAEIPASEIVESEISESSSEESESEASSCSNFKVDLNQTNFDKIPSYGDGYCFESPQGFLAAVVVDSTCKTTAFVKEYHSEDAEMRQAKNLCGYIVYEPIKGAKGIFEEDLFVIPFGNRGVK